MIDRRNFLGTLAGGLLASPFAASAQPAAKLPRIGILGNEDGAAWEGFRQGMRDLGYVDGRNVTLVGRWSEGRPERHPALARELVQANVDILVAASTQAIRAAMDASRTVPIVMAISAYPERIGLVESLARPGGNVTGLTNVAPELMGKRFQILRGLSPWVSRLAVLWNPANPTEQFALPNTQAAAAAAGMEVQPVELRTPEDFPAAFAAITAGRADALLRSTSSPGSSSSTSPSSSGCRAATRRGASSSPAASSRTRRASSTCAVAPRRTSTGS